MGQPLLKPELHDKADDYLLNHYLGFTKKILHREIGHPKERTWVYEDFINYINR